ncbi:phospholipase [Pseudomonas sp. PICF141]|uniref:phospholipase n=1 Tax=Pseudomonas sp. PICF141 TaxID=1949067 RepID=UPI000BABF7EC|nr:phospholipase [Pseudomonas sp. PICF141]PAU58307.1 phospholipase [Pseudomonas sp. PICF141]
MNNNASDNYALNNWMTATSAIDTLSLCQLTLPGTHNAGCDWKASYPIIPGAHWLACQHDSFYAQLNNGSRALDVRLDFVFDEPGLGKFRFQHNGYRSTRTLGHLVTDVNRFLQENPDEFIILDFHELKGSQQPFDYHFFNEMMLRFLGERMIPSNNLHLSLGQLKKLSNVQRVLVAAEGDRELDRTRFCKKVEHKWSGIADTNAAELEKHIIEVLKNPPGTWAPWSLSATCYSITGGPVDIKGHLTWWFDLAKRDWATQCNIINVDFIEESKIVSYCRAASLIKANKQIK